MSGRGEELVFITSDPDRFTASSDEAQEQKELEGGKNRFWQRIWNFYVCMEPFFSYLPKANASRDSCGRICHFLSHLLLFSVFCSVQLKPENFIIVLKSVSPSFCVILLARDNKMMISSHHDSQCSHSWSSGSVVTVILMSSILSSSVLL